MNILKFVPNVISLGRISSCSLLSPFQLPLQQTKHGLSILSNCSTGKTLLSKPESIAPRTNWLLNFVRTNIRNRFPRPSENKRIKVLGWRARLKTKGGRAIIMRRILKGRHVLSH